MQIVSSGDNLHKMPNPIFQEEIRKNFFNFSSAEFVYSKLSAKVQFKYGMRHQKRKPIFWYIPNKDLYQPVHQHSLIRIFIFCMKNLASFAIKKCAQWRFWSDCTGWSESLLGAHVQWYIISCWDSFAFKLNPCPAEPGYTMPMQTM